MNKINAAYSFGGPQLLAETIQDDTGLYINHYMDIGFGGFVQVVNAVGGVRMCLIHSLYDSASGLHLQEGLPCPDRRARRSRTSGTGMISPPRTCSASRTSGSS